MDMAEFRGYRYGTAADTPDRPPSRGAATATTLSLLVPIVSGLLSVLFFGEAFGFLKLLGAACVLASLLIVRYSPKSASRTSG